MIEKCANIIVDWLINCKVVKKTDKELYNYAVYSVLLSLYPLALAVGFGICMGCVRQSATIIMPFVIIRKFSGGYHTKHAWSCLIWSCLLLLSCIVISFYIKCGWGTVLITVGATVSLVCFSPIDNENRPLNKEEHSRYKRITTVLAITFLFMVVLLFMFQLYTYSICVSMGIILSAGLQLPHIIKKLVKNIARMTK